MTTTKKDPVVVVLQLTGGNDYANTVIRYADPLYRDNRPGIGIPEGQDSLSPNRHPEIASVSDILDMVERVRQATGKPVGFKTVVGSFGCPQHRSLEWHLYPLRTSTRPYRRC